MKKIFLVFALLALAAFFAAAEAVDNVTIAAVSSNAIVVSETDTRVGSTLEEQDDTLQVSNKPIERLHLVANGIAVSQSDAFDFVHARIIVGAMKVRGGNAADDGSIVKRLGVLMLDEKRYHLKDVAVSGEEVSAEIYGPTTDADANPPSAGEIKVKRFEKPGRDIWAGNMVLDGKAYNVYFLGLQRNFKLVEITDKIGDYCEQNPDDNRCKKAFSQCVSDTNKCKEKAKNYCEGNPADLGCLQLKKAYCLGNSSDERCLQYLKGLCSKYPGLEFCEIQTVSGKQVMTINQGKVSQITAEQGEELGELVRERARVKISSIKDSIDNVSAGTNRGD